MRKKLIYGFLICLAFFSCSDEDEISPSYRDVNWYSVEDDPNDPLTHLRYTIYQETGVPIFYNDTIGSQTRYRLNGDPYTYYEIIKPGYTIIGHSGGVKCVLADDLTDVMAMVELMDQYLFEYLPRDKNPLCYLLLDSVNIRAGNSTTYPLNDDYYKAMTATCIGNVERVKSMTDSARRSFAAELAGLELVANIVDEVDLTENLINYFDSLSIDVLLDAKEYGMTKTNGFGSVQTYVITRIKPEAELFGLIHYRGVEANRLFIPTKEQDRAAYIGLILSVPDDVIRERYKNYPVVIERYELMREMMVRVGLIEGTGEEENQ